MRRVSVLVSIVAVTLVALFAFGFVATRTAAQEGTPAPAPPGAVGLSVQLLGSGAPDAASDHQLALRQITFAPGATVGSHHHPGALALTVGSGALGYTVQEGEVTVVRATTDGTPGPTEQLTPGVETILNPGDALFEQSVVHTARNASDGETVVWVASLVGADEPFTVFDDGMASTAAATPAP